MAQEEVHSGISQSYQDNDNMRFPASEETIEDLKRQNDALAVEIIQLKQEYKILTKLLSSHDADRHSKSSCIAGPDKPI
ncbi:hypothetical protein BGZ63DRAFT_397050 [Mariannaea sp. PMI_226]|nr:hypothetical protein BGZ63DRAFT_397050 [Mariannaea sp. PMI_226]